MLCASWEGVGSYHAASTNKPDASRMKTAIRLFVLEALIINFVASTYVCNGLFKFHSKETGTLSSYIPLAKGIFSSG